MNRGQALRPRGFYVLGEIVEEYDTLRGYADGFHHMSIGRRVGFP